MFPSRPSLGQSLRSQITSRRSQPGLALSVVRKDFSGFISQVPGGSAFYVRLLAHAMSYYILQNDETKGPFTIGQLRSMWNSGAITGKTHFCQEGFSQWLPLSDLQSELEPPSQPSQPSPQFYRQPPQPVSHKVQTIEATSKSWKAIQLISALVMCIGIVAVMISPLLGGLMLVGGFCTFIFARIGAWWENG